MIRRDIYVPKFSPNRPPLDIDNEGRLKVGIKDKFKFTYRFEELSNPAYDIDFSKFDISIRYYTKGNEGSYYCMKIGKKVINAIIIDSQTIMKAIIENHNLQPGKLMAEFEFMYHDFEFASLTPMTSVVVDTNVTLIDE